MVLGDDDDRFFYMRVIGIYHAQVNVLGRSEPLIVDFLHTRRLAIDTNRKTRKRLPCVGFLSLADEEAFGFLDPNDVVRAAHLMPAYHWGHDEEDVPPLDSLAYRGDEELRGWDWFRLYVNMCVHYL
jgi:hypothetical protein